MRITNVMITNTMLGNINRNQRRANTFLNQLATGMRINTPSENPLMATRHIRLENNLNQISQHRRNVDHAISWTEITEHAVRDLVDVTRRLEDLLTRADSLETLPDRKVLAQEINSLLEEKRNVMNRNVGGRYVFSGLRTNNPPFLVADQPNKAVFDIEKNFLRDDIEQTWVLDRSYAHANPTSPVMIPNPAEFMVNPDHIPTLPVGAPIPNPDHVPGVAVGDPIPLPVFDPNAPSTVPNPILMITNPDFNPAWPVSELNSPEIRDPDTERFIPNPAFVEPLIANPGFDPSTPISPANPLYIANPAWTGEPEYISNPRWASGGDLYGLSEIIPNPERYGPNPPMFNIPGPDHNPDFPDFIPTLNPDEMILNPDHDPTVAVGVLIPHPEGLETITDYRTTRVYRVRLPHNANAGVTIPGVNVLRLDPNDPNHVLPAPREGQINFDWLKNNLVAPATVDNTIFHDPRNGDLFAFTNAPFEYALDEDPLISSNQFRVTYNQIGFNQGDLNPIVYFESRLWTGSAVIPGAGAFPGPFPWSIANPPALDPGTGDPDPLHDPTVPVGEWIVDPNFDGIAYSAASPAVPGVAVAGNLTTFTMAHQDMPFEFGVHSRMNINLLAANVFTGTMFADLQGFANDILAIQTTDLARLEQRFRNEIVIPTRFPLVDPNLNDPGHADYDPAQYILLNDARNLAIAQAGEELDIEARELAKEYLAREASIIETMTNDRFNNLIGRVDRYSNDISRQHTDLGTRMSRLDLIANRLQDDNVTFQTLSANNIGTDIAETVMHMSTAEVALMASMQAGMHQIMNMTLLNFL